MLTRTMKRTYFIILDVDINALDALRMPDALLRARHQVFFSVNVPNEDGLVVRGAHKFQAILALLAHPAHRLYWPCVAAEAVQALSFGVP